VNARFTSSAETELREAAGFYEAAENGLGARFLDEVEAVVARIPANPEAWAPMSPRTRRCRTHRFPFGLFCQIRADEILIASVMDLRRDPRSWEHCLLFQMGASGTRSNNEPIYGLTPSTFDAITQNGPGSNKMRGVPQRGLSPELVVPHYAG